MIKASELTTELRAGAAEVYGRQAERDTPAHNHYVFNLLLALVAFTAIPYGTAAPWWESFFECSVFALGIFWMFGALRRGEPLLMDALAWPWLTLLVFALAQTLPVWSGAGHGADAIAYEAGQVSQRVLSAAPFETRRFAIKLLALILTGTLLRSCVWQNEKRFRKLVQVVIALGVTSAAFGLARHLTQANDSFFVLPLLRPGVGFGQFINHNHFAILLEMAGGLLLGLVFSGDVPRERLPLYLAAGALIWTSLVLSNSLGGIFSMLGQLCFFAVLWPASLLRREGRNLPRPQKAGTERARFGERLRHTLLLRFGLVLCLLSVIIVGVIWVGGGSLTTRLDELPKELRSAQDANPRLRVRRLEMWAATVELIKANPVAGVGFGGFESAITQYYDASGNWTLAQAHNDYLELVASGGIIAALLLLWFVVMLVRKSRDQLRARNKFRAAAARGALAGLCGVAFHSLVDFGLHLTVNAVVCVALVVIATASVDGKGTETEAA